MRRGSRGRENWLVLGLRGLRTVSCDVVACKGCGGGTGSLRIRFMVGDLELNLGVAMIVQFW